MDIVLKPRFQDGSTAHRLYISLDPEFVLKPSSLVFSILTESHRNFKYPNPALNPNQSFPLFSGSEPPHQNEDKTSTTDDHFNLQAATAATNPNVPKTSNQTILLYARTEKLAKFSNHPKGFMNRTSWSPQPQPLISLPRSSWDRNQLVPYIPITHDPTWVDIIINNLDDGSHPFHLHGHDFFVVASSRSDISWGSYSPYKDGPGPVFNLENPLRKDTVSVPRRGYVVVRFRADNLGVWMLHCHVVFHQGSGMAMALQVGGEEGYGIVDESSGQLCVP